uniref:Ig-like domain-containing protein n=1 Tax=Oreochromis niloticus TaxID=8128 RepID=A0A669C9E8_ORENI
RVTGPMVRPSVSLLQPSSEKLSGGPVTLACLLTGYSPQGAEVRWEVDGTEVTEGVLNSLEEEKSSRYSSSSTLMLSQENWMNAEEHPITPNVLCCIITFLRKFQSQPAA